MNIVLYKTASPKKTVTKTLTNAITLSNCSFRTNDTPNDRDPVVVISSPISDLVKYNYCYIPAFSAYYFIRDRVARSASTTELVMHKDVLMTFDAGIRSHSAYVSRQETQRTQYANDPQFKTTDKEIVLADEFFSATVSTDFILAVAGE